MSELDQYMKSIGDFSRISLLREKELSNIIYMFVVEIRRKDG